MFGRFHREDGVSAVEFALIFPVLAILLFGIIEFGIAFMQLQTARGAVREGARQAAIMQSDGTRYDEGTIIATTVDAANGVQVAGVTVSPCGDGAGGKATVSLTTVGVDVSAPFLPSFDLDKTVSAQFLCEG